MSPYETLCDVVPTVEAFSHSLITPIVRCFSAWLSSSNSELEFGAMIEVYVKCHANSTKVATLRWLTAASSFSNTEGKAALTKSQTTCIYSAFAFLRLSYSFDFRIEMSMKLWIIYLDLKRELFENFLKIEYSLIRNWIMKNTSSWVRKIKSE